MPALPLILVDGSSYLYRAYHAPNLGELRSSRGQPTGAIYGVVNMLRRLQKDYPGSVITVVLDAKGKTFRDELFAEYKSQRPPMPEDLRPQVQPIKDIVQAMGLPLLVQEGVEADDVIGTLAAQATAAGQSVLISTGDKDMAQLVNDHVTLVNTMTDSTLDRAGVIQKFGLPPELIIDYLALMGDKSDNIPGVPGVGAKTAQALLQGLGNLDTIYKNLDKVKELSFRGAKSMGDKLAANEDQARLSYLLATIKIDVELPCSVDELLNNEVNVDELLRLYEELEFRAWANELKKETPKPEIQANYVTVLTQESFSAWLKKLEQAELFAFDTETTSLDSMQARIVGVSFSVSPGEAAYVPCAHDYLDAPNQLDLDWVLAQLKPLLENPSKAKVGQHLKYDRNVLLNHGVELRGIQFDTMLESYVLNSVASRHDLNSLAKHYLDHDMIRFEEVAGKGVKQLTFNQVALEQAAPYAAEDAEITLKLHQQLWPKLQESDELEKVFTEIEMPLLSVLSDIERNGALVDADLLGKQSIEIGQRLTALERRAHDMAGESFNLGSPKQLAEILYKKLELPVIKKTPKGAPSTAEDVLHELALDYPLPKLLLEHRSLAKLKSTYTDKLPTMINPTTGRIHTSYHQAVTATGRLSSTDPNLQNIPIRTPEGRKIRQAFIAQEGYQIVAADYSQIELRIMAHLSGDKGLMRAFNEDLDVHRATAAEVFATEVDKVSNEQRRSAKAINFGLIYGMSAFGLAKQIGVGRKDAQEYIDRYFDRYPGVKVYMEDTRALAAKKGYVETVFGRRLYLPEINARNRIRQQAAERTAINAPMQGTAADIIKRAMINVSQWLKSDQIDAKIIMQVHDELVLEVKNEFVDELIARLVDLMSEAVSLSVPLVVDAGYGSNWDQAH